MTSPLLIQGLAFGLGLVLWTFLEYVLHRWAFHERVLGMKVAREHIEHHAKVDYFAPLSVKLAIAAPIVGAIFVVGLVVGGAFAGAVSFASGLVIGVLTGWIVYEVIHRRIHVAGPINAYGRWARRHHLSHHFGNAKLNHGVSTPFWDHVFGTYAPDATVMVPRRHASKFPWLLEDPSLEPKQIALRSTWTEQYRLVG